MHYYYDKISKYVYQNYTPYSPNDVQLTDVMGKSFFNLTYEQQQLIQTGANGLPMMATPQPSLFYVWNESKEKWEIDEETKKQTVNNLINRAQDVTLNGIKDKLLEEYKLSSNKSNRTLIPHLYYASLAYLDNKTTANQQLELYAFTQNKTVDEVANEIIKNCDELNNKLIACDWYSSTYLVDKFNSLGDDFSNYLDYQKELEALTVDKILDLLNLQVKNTKTKGAKADSKQTKK